MRRIALVATAAVVLLALAMPSQSGAQTAPLAMNVPIQSARDVTTDTDRAQAPTYTCRRAWRCGPRDCGWRRICARPGSRSARLDRRYYWRAHEWRRHYW